MKTHIPFIKFLSFCLVTVSLLSACSKKSDSGATATAVPTVSTSNVIVDETAISAYSGGILIASGDAAVTANGVCWSATNQSPTVNDSKTTDTVGINHYTSHLTGLSPQTTYYLRAYATNTGGTGYGNTFKFITPSATGSTISTVTTFAGNGTAGLINGYGTSAQFNTPKGVAADAQGNLYVADSYNNAVRKITPGGVVSTIAGNGMLGYVDGPGNVAQFYSPTGIALDAQGNIYVTDQGNNMVRKITTAGVVSTFAGSGIAGYVDATGASAQFKAPYGINLDASGNVYVADRGNNIIRKISSAGVVTTLAGNRIAGYADTTGTIAQFNSPTGLVVNSAGKVYVTDQGNHVIRMISTTGAVTTLAGNYYLPTIVNTPNGIAVDTQNSLYFTDQNGRVSKLTSAQALYTLAGTANVYGFANGMGSTVQFNGPQAIAIDAQGNFYIADSNNHIIRKMTVTVIP